MVSGLFTGWGNGVVLATGRGWALAQRASQALVQELVRATEQACQEAGAGRHPSAMEVGQANQREAANLAWAKGLPYSWISSLCADPMDSPRPKGWETTLEPYRMLNHEE